MNAFLVTFQGFLSQLWQPFFKTPLDGYWQLLNLLWPEPYRVMFVYLSKIQDVKKSVVKALLNVFSQ